MCIGCSGTQAPHPPPYDIDRDLVFPRHLHTLQPGFYRLDLRARLPEIVPFPVPCCTSFAGAPCCQYVQALSCESSAIPSGHLFPFGVFVRAQNMCIGGSGTQASHPPWDFSAAQAPMTGTPTWSGCFITLAAMLRSLSCSFALSVVLLLIALLARPFKAQSSPLGILMGAYIPGTLLRALRGLAFSCPQHQVLDWQPWRNEKGRIPKRPPSGINGVGRLCIWVLLLLSAPEPVVAGPAFNAAWIILPPACAMTRTPQPGIHLVYRTAKNGHI